ncbi:DUF5054 domain-containing protein [Vagococcus sp. BWB3-3]|uniref:DUF5054 domain-containing protein n=1 Tax=Vagococcus allomyrinae TaxID=2794353 RepID=A0A940PIF0_9ENTE|nr:DUF5054 domain-containing protein [Vagococcus allomyrinae]MBP1043478.1 DUF5054 domain-containing protein [Vagococcus allomyrinae]
MTKTLHVVFKTHLDIGFTDLAKEVVKQYLTDFIPRALQIGEEVPDQFVWTTGSWLIHFYLNHPEVAEADKERMAAAIKRGTIKWHGLPVTFHSELMDQRLFEYGLSLSQNLDKQYGTETVAGKLTDVPGHTIGIVPLMAKAGLKYLHIGVNASSAIPKVPEMFLWRNSDGSEIVVHYAQDYGETFIRDGWDDMLYFAHSHDNAGPPKDSEEVIELLARLKDEHPDATIVASSLDDFAEAAWAKRQTLPVIEEEIGDTWIHGVASDPLKIANYFSLLRLRDQWLDNGQWTVASQEYQNFSEQLLLIAEHTWGGNGNVFLPDYKNYLIEDFQAARQRDAITFNHDRSTMDFGDLMALISTDIESADFRPKRSYRLYEESWQEQRDYVTAAVACLSAERQAEAKRVLAPSPIIPLETGEQVMPGRLYQFDDLSLSFSTTGGINQLIVEGRHLIGAGREFGGISYERFDFGNYNDFLSKYSRLTRWTSSWCLVDFAKRGIEAFQDIRYELIKPMIKTSSISRTGQQLTVIFDLCYTRYQQKMWGLPTDNQLVYEIDLAEKSIKGSLKWQGKQGNRMPEAYWLETSLQVANPYRWQMDKLGTTISPYNVVENGNRYLHGLSQKGLSYSGSDGPVTIKSLDAPLFSFGRRGLLVFDNQQPSLNDGIYVNLQNNVWGTNFPAWFEDDMLYRFEAWF